MHSNTKPSDYGMDEHPGCRLVVTSSMVLGYIVSMCDRKLRPINVQLTVLKLLGRRIKFCMCTEMNIKFTRLTK